jgi:hypothetical protein
VVAATLAGFVLASAAGVNPAWAALVGVVVLGARALALRRTSVPALARAADAPGLPTDNFHQFRPFWRPICPFSGAETDGKMRGGETDQRAGELGAVVVSVPCGRTGRELSLPESMIFVDSGNRNEGAAP